MKKASFDKRNLKEGHSVIRVIIQRPQGKTTNIGLVEEIGEDYIILIHNLKRDKYLISDLVGLSIEREL